ncbi:NAD-dependent deacylase [Methylocystis sp. IM3]|uniref:NAD-dependent deacylase n=1 Tax=unclassified Methylocystis TaxID=2625913 RepID=UPI0030FAED67
MRIFVLTGAGVSAESGLGTFRDASGTGLWARFDPMTLATPEAFARTPEAVHEFYNFRRRNLLSARPNAAHDALARLQREMAARGGAAMLVTQNIDDLHERGGAREVIHMHGELLKARCAACGGLRDQRADLSTADRCGDCGRVGAMRPHVVWFGETPLHMEEITAALAAASLFVSIGTSGSVYPAAGFVSLARRLGVATCEINLEPSDNAGQFDQTRYGAASELVPAWVEEMLR